MLMLKLLIFRCTRCSETGAHSDHFLLHINTGIDQPTIFPDQMPVTTAR